MNAARNAGDITLDRHIAAVLREKSSKYVDEGALEDAKRAKFQQMSYVGGV